jgi:hypothetical protein
MGIKEFKKILKNTGILTPALISEAKKMGLAIVYESNGRILVRGYIKKDMPILSNIYGITLDVILLNNGKETNSIDSDYIILHKEFVITNLPYTTCCYNVNTSKFDYHIISINPCKTTKLLNDLERNPQPFIDSYKNAISLLADLTDLYTILESDIKESHCITDSEIQPKNS